MENHDAPEPPADKLREMVAGLIDVVATQGTRAIDTFGLRTGPRSPIPNVDVVECQDEVLVFVDLPGVDPKHVEILLTGNMLTVKGELPAVEGTPGRTVHRRERPVGVFLRSIPLPVSVNAEQVSAESRFGVLSIRIGKAERASPRQIPIDIRSA